MRSFFCLLTFCLGVLQAAFAQQSPSANLSPFPPGSPMAAQQTRLFQDLTRAQQKYYQAKVDSVLALKRSYPRLSTTRKPRSATLGNGCGLHADCTPEQDTTVVTGSLTLKNTTIGADSYEWIDENFSSFPTPNEDLVLYPSVGVSRIRLVAHQGNCTDTADRYIVVNGTPPSSNSHNTAVYGQPGIINIIQCIAADPTDGYLLAGTSGGDPYRDQSGNPYFVRVSENGCILWSKLINSYYSSRILSVLPMPGGGFVVLASGGGWGVTGMIYRFDANGNILWTKSIVGTGWELMSGMKLLSDGGFLIMGRSGLSVDEQMSLERLDANGNFIWQHQYAYDTDDWGFFYDAVESGGQIYAAGYYSARTPDPNQFQNYLQTNYGVLAKIDLASGNMGWLKAYPSPGKSWYPNRINLYNGGLLISGIADSVYNGNHLITPVLVEVNLDGSPRNAKLIWMGSTFYISTMQTIVQPDNSISFMFTGASPNPLGLQGNFSGTFYMRLDQQKNILWSKYFGGQGTWSSADAAPSPNAGMAIATMSLSSLTAPLAGWTLDYELYKTDANGSLSNACHEWDYPGTAGNMDFVDSSMTVMTATFSTFSKRDTLVVPVQPRSQMRFVCPDYVPLCSFMEVTGKDAVCNMSQTYDYIAHKDPACADPVVWDYDHSKIRTVSEDGSKASLQFLEPGVFVVKARKPYPCIDIVDSVIVTVSAALMNYTLGNDTTICSGDSLILRPTGKYDVYLWQDNSAADSFIVRIAGVYRCTVTDSCGNQKTDDVTVSYHSEWTPAFPAPISKCPADTVLLPVTTGLHLISWSPADQWISMSSGGFGAFARTNTDYILNALDPYECTVKADWLLTVWPTPVIRLGADTTICPEGMAVLSAPSGFDRYVWSTGSVNSEITVNPAGNYWVVATDGHGCSASDTVRVNHFTGPQPKITGNNWICRGQITELDAGDFSTYLWLDGSQNRRFTVTDTGYFHVTVTDMLTCSGGAGLHIEGFAESPTDFLPADTTVCSRDVTMLATYRPFSSYLWSTGETGSSLKVSQAGLYRVEVVDEKGCFGADSSLVTAKDCEAIIWFPNAFTPNGDGINDVFRLKFPGRAANYHLEIFNRWGQRVFESKDPAAGWNGGLSSLEQPVGTYIWMVRWSSPDGVAHQNEGSVLLIR
jgi:gliding motility-associated-like protein